MEKYSTQRVTFKDLKLSLTELKLERAERHQNSKEKADNRQTMDSILVVD
jgi:hypothetical protein